jgi:surfeit locus 1 family protein
MTTETLFGKINPMLVLAGLCCLGVFTAAGIWQVQRAHYKERLQTQMASAANEPAISLSAVSADADRLNFHKVSATGHWVADKTIFIDNKVNDGVVGYHVVTPLHIEGSAACVLVNRGWVAAPRLRSELPQIQTPATPVVVGGIARTPTERFIELAPQTVVGRVWQNLTVERFQAWSGLELAPVVIYQADSAEGALMRVTPAPEASGLGADRHRGYAFLWFAMAALTAVLIVITTMRSLKSK